MADDPRTVARMGSDRGRDWPLDERAVQGKPSGRSGGGERHKRESPYPTPNLSNILAAVGNIVHERSIGQRERYTRDESAMEWIERTVAASTPQQRARVIEEVPAAAHMGGLMAVGLEKLRSTH